jgi:hypothetical protein
MSKKNKIKINDSEKSLIEGITLMHRPDVEDSIWATYWEIKDWIEKEYEIFNDEKREIYDKKHRCTTIN